MLRMAVLVGGKYKICVTVSEVRSLLPVCKCVFQKLKVTVHVAQFYADSRIIFMDAVLTSVFVRYRIECNRVRECIAVAQP